MFQHRLEPFPVTATVEHGRCVRKRNACPFKQGKDSQDFKCLLSRPRRQSLHGLRLSFCDWLKEADPPTIAALERLARCNIQDRRERLAQSSFPQVEIRFSVVLVRTILLEYYEERLRRVFDKGYDLNAPSVPSLS